MRKCGFKDTPLAANAACLISGVQQRLLSSIPAFARTLRRHLATLKRYRDKVAQEEASEAGGALIAQGAMEIEPSDA